jgi:hypothetical protein
VSQAGDKPKRRIERRHHKVDKLPPALRDELARKFQAGETYENIAGWLQDEGHPISRSSIHRWGVPFERQLEKLKAWRDGATTIVGAVQGKPATELSEAAEQIAVQQLMELLILLGSESENEIEGEPRDLAKQANILGKVSASLSSLGYTGSYREKVKLGFQKAFAEEAAKKVAAAVGDAKVEGKSVVETVREALGLV